MNIKTILKIVAALWIIYFIGWAFGFLVPGKGIIALIALSLFMILDGLPVD